MRGCYSTGVFFTWGTSPPVAPPHVRTLPAVPVQESYSGAKSPRPFFAVLIVIQTLSSWSAVVSRGLQARKNRNSKWALWRFWPGRSCIDSAVFCRCAFARLGRYLTSAAVAFVCTTKFLCACFACFAFHHEPLLRVCVVSIKLLVAVSCVGVLVVVGY